MINNKSVIGIIPARSGSKRLKKKNIINICGKPLIAWTIEKALLSKYLDAIVVTTDSHEIANIAKSFGAEVPCLRPADIATDNSSSYEAIKHILENYLPRKFDYSVLLEPTSPLREDDDIDRVIEQLSSNSKNFDSIITLGKISLEHPSRIKKFSNLSENSIQPFCTELSLGNERKIIENAYFPYGVAYMAKTSILLNEMTFYTERCMGFLIQRYQNYEIDDLYDLLCVEAIMKNKWGLK
jgi:CMP-N,N'-diacetyllegionaminic acid synthase